MENIFDRIHDFQKNRQPGQSATIFLSLTIADEQNQVAFAQGIVNYIPQEDFRVGKQVERASEQVSTNGNPPLPLNAVAADIPNFTKLDIAISNVIFAQEIGCSLESNGERAFFKLVDTNGILNGNGDSILSPGFQASYSITYSFSVMTMLSGEINKLQKEEIAHH